MTTTTDIEQLDTAWEELPGIAKWYPADEKAATTMNTRPRWSGILGRIYATLLAANVPGASAQLTALTLLRAAGGDRSWKAMTDPQLDEAERLTARMEALDPERVRAFAQLKVERAPAWMRREFGLLT